MTGTFMMSRRSTSIKSILLSTPHPKHRITASHTPVRTYTSFEEVRARAALRQAAPPSSHVSLRSADIETAPHWTRCGPRSRRQHKVEDQQAVGFHDTNQSDYASRRRPPVSKKRGLLARSLLAAWLV